MSEAYLLVSHGSRDPRPEAAMEKLAINLSNKFENNSNNHPVGGLLSPTKYDYSRFALRFPIKIYPSLSPSLPLSLNHLGNLLPGREYLIGTAYLELHPQSLNKQIVDFSQKAIARGCRNLKILPLFLLSGIHVTEDIPQEVELAKQALGKDISIDLQPHLGSYFSLQRLLVKTIGDRSLDGRIIVAHGSRRVEANKSIETMAISLNAVAAYWAISPSLKDMVAQLVADGKRKIGILPYFLFSGSITDAITQSIQDLKLLFPEVSFQRYEPLGANGELIDLIWDLMHK